MATPFAPPASHPEITLPRPTAHGPSRTRRPVWPTCEMQRAQRKRCSRRPAKCSGPSLALRPNAHHRTVSRIPPEPPRNWPASKTRCRSTRGLWRAAPKLRRSQRRRARCPGSKHRPAARWRCRARPPAPRTSRPRCCRSCGCGTLRTPGNGSRAPRGCPTPCRRARGRLGAGCRWRCRRRSRWRAPATVHQTSAVGCLAPASLLEAPGDRAGPSGGDEGQHWAEAARLWTPCLEHAQMFCED
mmetsp:Transcript_36308/g.104320  ORF Transcript_36308/g.104320 Transcript_36308/m.104320 type:complete len:243 (+) Transcript_36308:767-1495(+)